MNVQGMISFLIISFLLKSFGSTVIETIEQRIDCEKIRHRMSSNSSAISHGILPACLNGGLWRPFQCNISSCKCTYVDTGRPYSDYPSTSSTDRRTWKDCDVKMEKKRDGCQVPFLHYPCNNTVIKYVYNTGSHQCEARIGCSGFLLLEDCRRACILGTPSHPASGNCTMRKHEGEKCSQPSGRYYWHNQRTHQCESFIYKGCGGNLNKFPTLWSCKKNCVLQRRRDGLIVMNGSTTYNLTLPEGIVEKHKLRLYQPNHVNHSIFRDIARNVLSAEVLPPEVAQTNNNEAIERGVFPDYVICRQKPSTSIACRATMFRWYFDFSRGRCVSFLYGGCYTNGNNFLSKKKCKNFCSIFHTSS